jgi:hypothetical protein
MTITWVQTLKLKRTQLFILIHISIRIRIHVLNMVKRRGVTREVVVVERIRIVIVGVRPGVEIEVTRVFANNNRVALLVGLRIGRLRGFWQTGSSEVLLDEAVEGVTDSLEGVNVSIVGLGERVALTHRLVQVGKSLLAQHHRRQIVHLGVRTPHSKLSNPQHNQKKKKKKERKKKRKYKNQEMKLALLL